LEWVVHNKVHGEGACRIDSCEGNVGRTCLPTDGDFCLAVDTLFPQDHCERISNSVVALYEPVLLAAKQMVTKGVEGLTAHGARGSGIIGDHLASEPPPDERAVL
jgi:hypothetical protein